MQQSGLTPEELNRVLTRAAERQREAVAGDEKGSRTSMREAEAIAEELGIAPEHVRAALAEAPSRNAPAGRMASLLRWGGVGALLGGGALLALGPTLLGILLLALGAGALVFSFLVGGRGASTAVPRTALPLAGTCRICGAPAYNERATFCEEHRYRGVGSGQSG